MGQSRQLRSPLPGRKKVNCWPLRNEQSLLFHETDNIEENHKWHCHRVNEPCDLKSFRQLDKELLFAAQSQDESQTMMLAKRWGLQTKKPDTQAPLMNAPLSLNDEGHSSALFLAFLKTPNSLVKMFC